MHIFVAQCTHCRSIDFRMVGWRNTFEKAIRWFVLPYRCELCGHHFFLFRWHNPLIKAA
jgi:hypothetical protein